MPATQQQCNRFINWRALKLSPAELFELESNYTENDINEAYEKFAFIFSADQNPGQETLVQPAFKLLVQIRNILIYPLDKNEENLKDNDFYRYYIYGTNPNSNSIYDQLEMHSKRIEQNLSINEDSAFFEAHAWAHKTPFHIEYLTQLVTKHPEIITYTYDKRSYSHPNENVVCCAAHWNQPALFAQLLELHADPTLKTEFGMSPVEIAISKQHTDILSCLQKKYGNAWLQSQFDTALNLGNPDHYEALIHMYEHFFPEKLPDTGTLIQNNPLLIPVLYRIKKINEQDYNLLIKAKIIGIPKLYQHVSIEEQQDPYLILALLAQDRSEETLRHIPFKKLNPAFCAALTDVWPEDDLERHVSWAASLCHSLAINKAIMLKVLAFTLATTLLCALAVHFFPLIMLVPALPECIISVLPGLELASLLLSSVFSYQYLTETYPEKQKINKILTDNNFFKPLPADDEPSMPPEQGQSSVCGYLRGLVA
jgi:hypothetical protein